MTTSALIFFRATYPVQRQSAYRASSAGFARETGNFDDRWSLAPEYFRELGIFPPVSRSSAVRRTTLGTSARRHNL
jgi:hypothetical protein